MFFLCSAMNSITRQLGLIAMHSVVEVLQGYQGLGGQGGG